MYNYISASRGMRVRGERREVRERERGGKRGRDLKEGKRRDIEIGRLFVKRNNLEY